MDLTFLFFAISHSFTVSHARDTVTSPHVRSFSPECRLFLVSADATATAAAKKALPKKASLLTLIHRASCCHLHSPRDRNVSSSLAQRDSPHPVQPTLSVVVSAVGHPPTRIVHLSLLPSKNMRCSDTWASGLLACLGGGD